MLHNTMVLAKTLLTILRIRINNLWDHSLTLEIVTQFLDHQLLKEVSFERRLITQLWRGEERRQGYRIRSNS